MSPGRFLGVIAPAFVAVICGVAAASTLPAPGAHHAIAQRGGGWMVRKPNPKHTWMYVSGFSDNSVYIYDVDAIGVPQIGEIKQGLNGPAGIVLDAQGTLYVANYLGVTVTVYPPGQTTPSLTLSNDIALPVGVGVDANRNVYVTNGGGSPSILVYPPGQTTPSATITSPLFVAPNAILIDPHGNLYLSDEYTQISEMAAGSQQLVSLGLQGIHNSTGVAVDPITGNLFVATLNAGSAVHVFKPGTVDESYELVGSGTADFITIGAIKGQTYLFAPYSAGSTVRLYRHERKNIYATLSAPSSAHQVAIKPPNVP